MMKYILALIASVSIASCTSDNDCGPFGAWSSFERHDTVNMNWPAPSLTIDLPYPRYGQPYITRWQYFDSIRVLATHRGNTRYDTLEFDHRIIEDSVLEFYVKESRSIGLSLGSSIECSPPPDLYFETELSVFAPEGYEVTFR